MEKICGCCSVSRGNQQLSDKLDTPMNFVSRKASKADMIYLQGGEFLMGTNDPDANPYDQEGPIRRKVVVPFYIDPYAVTNKQFQEFVEHTNYKTDAEKFGWSFVFHAFLSDKVARKVTQAPVITPWWRVVGGAYWYQPEGPDSIIEDRMEHPVVHVSWNDAKAYCDWAGKRLPTEVEWEFAARGGLTQKRFPWGDELTPKGEQNCNIWQGDFPIENTLEDGYHGTAPVDAFKPNQFQLYNMVGNVWEWCENWFSHANIDDSQGVNNTLNLSKAMRGGSYLCHDSYCNRYRVAARTSNTPDSSTGNIGFRCVMDA